MKADKDFGLKENPFVPSPNPRFLYLTDQTNACLFKCKFVIEEGQGLALIVGKIGYGKTSVLRELLNGYIDDETYKALKALYVASRGVPREIMKIANASLLLAAVNQTKPIDEEIIKLAVENILSTERNGEPEAAELRAGASQ